MASEGGEYQYFGAEITDYACLGDTSIYKEHVFNVRAWVDQRMYSVQRSYESFCELDAQLRRKYPRSAIPPIPLSGSALFVKRAAKNPDKDIFNSESKMSVVDLRASMSSASADLDLTNLKKKSRPPVRRTDMSEIISQKKGPLNLYLKSIQNLPEILLSEIFVSFFDEESADGEVIPPDVLEVTEVDILIADETPVSKTILGKHKVNMAVDPGYVIIWDFNTKYYDIGFSIFFARDEIIDFKKLEKSISSEGIEVVKYQRYNSHIKPVKGCLDISERGYVQFVWDNKYSMMRAKQVAYTVKAFGKGEVELAKQLAAEALRARRQYATKRQQLKVAIGKSSSDILAKSGRSQTLFTSPGFEESSDSVRFGEDSMEDRLKKLQDEKYSLQLALTEAEALLVSERRAAADYIDRIEEVQAQRDASERQIESLRLEAERLGYLLQTARGSDRQEDDWRMSVRITGTRDSFGDDDDDACMSQQRPLELYAATKETEVPAEGVGDSSGTLFASDKRETADDVIATLLSLQPSAAAAAAAVNGELGEEEDATAAAAVIESATVQQLHEELKAAENEKKLLLDTIDTLKRERKQLKSYAKLVRQEAEMAKQQLEQEGHEKYLVVTEREQLASKLAALQVQFEAQAQLLIQANAIVYGKSDPLQASPPPSSSSRTLFSSTFSKAATSPPVQLQSAQPAQPAAHPLEEVTADSTVVHTSSEEADPLTASLNGIHPTMQQQHLDPLSFALSVDPLAQSDPVRKVTKVEPDPLTGTVSADSLSLLSPEYIAGIATQDATAVSDTSANSVSAPLLDLSADGLASQASGSGQCEGGDDKEEGDRGAAKRIVVKMGDLLEVWSQDLGPGIVETLSSGELGQQPSIGRPAAASQSGDPFTGRTPPAQDPEDPFVAIESSLKSMWELVPSWASKPKPSAPAPAVDKSSNALAAALLSAPNNESAAAPSSPVELKDWAGRRPRASFSLPSALRSVDTNSPVSQAEPMMSPAANESSNPISAWYLHPDRDRESSKVLTEQLEKQINVADELWVTHHIAWDAYCEDFLDVSKVFDLASPKRTVANGVYGSIKLKRTEPYGPLKCGVFLEGFRGLGEYTVTLFRFGHGSPKQNSSVFTWDMDDTRGWAHFMSAEELLSGGYITGENKIRVLLTLCLKQPSSRIRQALFAFKGLTS